LPPFGTAKIATPGQMIFASPRKRTWRVSSDRGSLSRGVDVPREVVAFLEVEKDF
jgi:hypothetical protein